MVVVGGVEYKAVIDSSKKGCSACALSGSMDKFGDCYIQCVPEDRCDRCNVIFKRHYRPKHDGCQLRCLNYDWSR